jgi:3-oxoacyl-[acyl-carrier protein] reductase
MNVLITGTSRGVGQALAKTFAESNHTVIAVSRSVQAPQANVHNVQLDYSTADGLTRLIMYLNTHNIKIDVLINNAATLINKPFEDNTADDFKAIFNTNVAAPYFLIQQLVANNLFVNKGASVYNISSMGGFQGSSKFAGLSLYSMTKGTVSTMTEVLAEELKEKHITVNAFALGAVATQMLKDAFPDYHTDVDAISIAKFIMQFALSNIGLVNGKIIPVSSSTP